jgi:N-acetyl-anhydromuramyl-L-alanine amidase AmpD
MRTLCLSACLLFASLAWCNPPQIIDITSKVNFGHHVKEKRNVDIIVIHSTHCLEGDPYDVMANVQVFQHYKVASHYMIDRKGQIYRLVAEKDIAYQAGKSVLPQNGRQMLNGSSIGIELLNSPTDPPTELQYTALTQLVKDIKTRYPIQYIVGHSDIASDRKTDPWLFDWKKFNVMLGK